MKETALQHGIVGIEVAVWRSVILLRRVHTGQEFPVERLGYRTRNLIL